MGGRASCALNLTVGLARTTYIQCIYDVLGRKIIKCTVLYVVYIQSWPTLLDKKGPYPHVMVALTRLW